MIIVIEGPDGGGKSTLATKMAKQTGYKLIRMSYPKTEEEEKLMAGDYLQKLKSAKNIIFDRAWYSEMVYGPIKGRNPNNITYPMMYKLEEKITQSGGLLIHCTGPKSLLWKRASERGEDYINKHEFDKVYDGYLQLMSIPHYIPVVHYVVDDL